MAESRTIIHVKNLEKYQPGYTDRKHIWAKIYFETFLDDAVQVLDEIDRYRYWSLIVLEVYLEGKPLCLAASNLALMGWNTKKRPKSKTIQMLHTLVDVCNGEPEKSVPQIRLEESRVEEKDICLNDFIQCWNNHSNLKPAGYATPERKAKFASRLKEPVFRDNWRTIIDAVSESPFHTGKNDRGWRADLNWILKNGENYVKVLEDKRVRDTEREANKRRAAQAAARDTERAKEALRKEHGKWISEQSKQVLAAILTNKTMPNAEFLIKEELARRNAP